ncbi:hypothetical protein SteCoe_36690 [Stentor coeruleus]|uniref:PKD/REJ-like domain-containing protein n=1 Tax=Stentor coeruleus TaxID=5963 RepID=A0A1R2APT4_9CILI|nr:hypothetical protein SteCoe_36690 [Stentor coeruleus]
MANGKTKTASVELTILEGVKGGITLFVSVGKLQTDIYNSIVPTISDATQATFSWAVTEGVYFPITSTFSYLVLSPNVLSSGTKYTLSVTLNSPDSVAPIQAVLSFKTNSPPICEDLYVTLYATPVWDLIAYNCDDGDSSDYPVTYQFGAILNSLKSVYLNTPLSFSEIQIALPSDTKKVTAKVCDSLGSCSIYTNSTGLKGRRTENDEKTIEAFQTYIINPENIPSGITYYATAATSSTIDIFFNSFFNYFEDSYIDSFTFDLMLDSIYTLFRINTKVSDKTVNKVITLLLNTLNNYITFLSSTQVKSIFSSIETLSSKIISSKMVALINQTRKLWIKSQIPNISVSYQNTLSISFSRVHYKELTGYRISQPKLQAVFADSADISDKGVYDVSFAKFYSGDEETFKYSISQSGQYANYTLSLYEPIELYDSVALEAKIFSDNTHAKNLVCEAVSEFNWTSGACHVKSWTSYYTVVGLKYPCTFRVVQEKDSENELNLAIFIAYGVLFAGLLLVFLVYCRDRNSKVKRKIKKLVLLLVFLVYCRDRNSKVKRKIKKLVEIYPVTGLMISQDRIWRIVLALQLSASQALLLALIGAYFKYMASNTEYTIANILQGAICLLISQAYTLSLTLVNFSILRQENSSCSITFSILTSIFVFTISISSIIFLIYDDMIGIEYLWLTSFAISSAIDIFVVQVIYSLILITRNQWAGIVVIPDLNLKSNVTEYSFARSPEESAAQKRISDLPLIVEDKNDINGTPREGSDSIRGIQFENLVTKSKSKREMSFADNMNTNKDKR